MKYSSKILLIFVLSSVLIAVGGSALGDDETEGLFKSWFSGKKAPLLR